MILVLDELQKGYETSQVNKAVYSQPLCTALQIALVDLLYSWDIHPNSVTGHSSGEIAAAYCAGAISLENAMLVAYARGCATTDLATKGVRGGMVAVGMTREKLSPILSDLRNGKAVVACSNSPSSITVSGDKSALDELQQVLREQGVYNRRLVVGVAYHSHHMTLVADNYRAAISNFKASEGNEVDFFSAVTGKLSENSKLGPEYWVSNLVGEVKFAQSLRQMGNHQGADSTSQVQTLVEIGPHSALAGPIRQIFEADEGLAKLSIEYLAILTRKKDAVTTALGVASTLFLYGHTVQMSAVNQHRESKIPPLIDLPPYAWNHTRTYSAESRISKAYREREHPKTDLLGVLDVHSSTLEPRWRQIIRLSELPWVRDHKIQSTVIYLAAGYITMAMEAARQRILRAASGTQILGYQFRDVNISSALLIPETPDQVEVIITLKAFSESVRTPSNLWDEFSVSSVSSENRWTEHCRGLIAVQTPPKTLNPVSGPAHEDSIRAINKDLVENLETICQTPVEAVELYSHLSQIGMQYGPTFANIQDVRSTPGHCISRAEIPDTRVVLPMQYEQVSVVHLCTLGCECGGVVSAVAGDIVNGPHGLRVGDRVMCLSSGSFCTRLRLDARLAERIPDSMSFETAAALPITHVTAYHSLHKIARLGRGETILIHAATGGLGQAFVEMSQLAGAEVFVTVGSAKKKSFIMDRFGLAEERILYSRDMSFASDVMRLTGGRGVDVIVNSLAGEALRQSWTCIAPYGRFVELGQRDITINTRLDMAPFARNASFTAYNLSYTIQSNPQAVRDVLVEVLALFSRGALRGPDPLETYDFSELQQAFRKMQTGRHMGKLVAIAKSDDIIKHIPVTTVGPLLRSDAAYLLVGGLGGIGRATALWMASRGARHLIFLNRSGLESEAARNTVSALQAAGCTAAVYACDVADAAQLASTMDKARQQLPPIRGVIQGAMVLRDCMLDKMSLEDYLAVLRPKLHGTWNLHAHLPTDVDFFLMESSISGIIGNIS